jgi:hypothetical protein
MNNKLIELLNEECQFIFDNDKSFMDKFCGLKFPELTSVTFNSNYVHFAYYDINTGAHFSDAVSLIEYDNWKEKILND